jgi:hypothetical protein
MSKSGSSHEHLSDDELCRTKRMDCVLLSALRSRTQVSSCIASPDATTSRNLVLINTLQSELLCALVTKRMDTKNYGKKWIPNSLEEFEIESALVVDHGERERRPEGEVQSGAEVGDEREREQPGAFVQPPPRRHVVVHPEGRQRAQRQEVDAHDVDEPALPHVLEHLGPLLGGRERGREEQPCAGEEGAVGDELILQDVEREALELALGDLGRRGLPEAEVGHERSGADSEREHQEGPGGDASLLGAAGREQEAGVDHRPQSHDVELAEEDGVDGEAVVGA